MDVEGFQVDDVKCWKYVMIIAFLNIDLIILNKKTRFDDVHKMLTIIDNTLKKMEKMRIPRILKIIYIQTVKTPKKSINDLLESFKYDKYIIKGIKFK